MDLESSFQAGCDEITAALAAKGITPDSNSPEDIANAIGNISAKPLIFTRSPVNMALYTDKWEQLTTQDFIVGFTQATANVTASYMVSGPPNIDGNANAGVTINYDSTSGILSFSGTSGSNSFSSIPQHNIRLSINPSGTIFAVWKGTINGQY